MCVCVGFSSFFCQSRLTEGVLFSTVRLSVRPSVRLFVRPVCLLPTVMNLIFHYYTVFHYGLLTISSLAVS